MCAWVSLLGLVLGGLSLSPYLVSSTEWVRLRNAWLLHEPGGAQFEWTPANVPTDYLQETGRVDPFFKEVAKRLNLAAQADDWARAVVISRHLLSSSPVLKGEAVKSDLRSTYEHVVKYGDGYCADFVDVFVALALAAGMQVRTWSFSFDGFGGHGHVWPEIWNRQQSRWQLVDVFNNYYFFEADAEPLSALGFRRALMSGSKELRLAPLDRDARLGWAIEAKAWDYYRRGLPGWYMGWGNNVFTYDRVWSVRFFSGVSRSLEEVGAMVQRVHPPVRLLVDATNQVQAQALWRLHWYLLFVAGLTLVCVLALLACLGVWVFQQRRLIPATPNGGLTHEGR
jgi:hypothetical protein